MKIYKRRRIRNESLSFHTDIDECSEPADSPDVHKCSENADCTNVDPSDFERGYTCECIRGFSGDGISCNPGKNKNNILLSCQIR